MGHAILNYERSLRLDPGNDDSAENLELVRLLIADRVESAVPEVRAKETLRRLISRALPDWLAFGMLFGIFGVCLTISWWLLGGRQSGLTVAIVITAATIAAGCAGIAGLQRWMSEVGSASIVLQPQVEARFEPRLNAKVGFVLHEGTKVLADRQESDWILVEIANGLRGWVPRATLEAI